MMKVPSSWGRRNRPLIDDFLVLLVRWQTRVNLVSRKELPRVVEKHVAPSLMPLLSPEMPAGHPRRVLDVGSGGGFPGVVLALLRPLRLTLEDGVFARYNRDPVDPATAFVTGAVVPVDGGFSAFSGV